MANWCHCWRSASCCSEMHKEFRVWHHWWNALVSHSISAFLCGQLINPHTSPLAIVDALYRHPSLQTFIDHIPSPVQFNMHVHHQSVSSLLSNLVWIQFHLPAEPELQSKGIVLPCEVAITRNKSWPLLRSIPWMSWCSRRDVTWHFLRRSTSSHWRELTWRWCGLSGFIIHMPKHSLMSSVSPETNAWTGVENEQF